MTTHYNELLKLCGFEQDEIERQKHRIESTFQKLDLGPEDMERAVSRVRKSFDMELLGIRKVLGVWLKELFDVVLAGEEGKKLIYYGYPPLQYTGLVIKSASKSKDECYIGCPEVVLCQTLGQIFGKLNPVLEAGEAAGLAPGHAMCSLLQIKNGALLKGMIPVPDMSIATSYFCDMGPKADEMMQERYGYPVEFIDSCMDSKWGEWPDYDPERVHYLGGQMNQLFISLNDRMGIKIDEAVWNSARKLAGRLYSATHKLDRLLATDPVPLGVAETELILNLSMACTGIAMEEGAEAIEILVEEVEKRVEDGIGVVPKNAPRVLLAFPSFVDPAFNRLIQDVGLAVPVSMTLLPPPPVPRTGSYSTLGEKRAEIAMLGGMYHSSYGMVKRIEAGLKYTEVDGILYSYQFSCRPLVCNTKLLKLHFEKESGLPTLLLDIDMYDDRNYSAEALRTRLEAFAEMLKAKKVAI